jgi:hypothetical protein
VAHPQFAAEDQSLEAYSCFSLRDPRVPAASYKAANTGSLRQRLGSPHNSPGAVGRPPPNLSATDAVLNKIRF